MSGKADDPPDGIVRRRAAVRGKPTFKCPRNGVDERPLMADGLNRSRGRGSGQRVRFLGGPPRGSVCWRMRQSASFSNRSPIMTSLQANASPLRQRMIDDMRMRQLSPKTQDTYLRIVREFARFLGRSPDTATVEDLRRYQLHLVDHGTSPVSLNHAITGLKFFFEVTLNQAELMARMQPVVLPRTLPVVLSPEEVARLIAAAGN